MPLNRPLWRHLSSRSRTPASSTQKASRNTASTLQWKSPKAQLARKPSTTAPISTGVSMPVSHFTGVSFQRTITPTASTSISRAISGTNRALK